MNTQRSFKKRWLAGLIAASLVSTAGAVPTYWARNYGGNGYEKPRALVPMVDGGYLAAGWTDSFGAGGRDIWVTRTDAQGDLLWAKTLGSSSAEEAVAMDHTADGGAIIAGSTYALGDGYDWWLVKLAGDGSVEWQRAYTGGQGRHEYARAVRQTPDGGYVVAGHVDKDLWVMKLAADGSVVWQQDYGKALAGSYSYDPVDDAAEAIAPTSDGGFIVAGHTQFFGGGQQWRNHAWILRLAADGQLLWNREFGGYTSWDELYSVQQTPDSGYLAVGSSNPADQPANALVIKLDASGNTEWVQTLGGPGTDEARAVAVTPDGGYLVTGFYGQTNQSRDLWLIRLSSDGTLQWQRTFGTPTHSDAGVAVVSHSDGTIGVLGSFFAGISDDFWLLQLDTNGELGGGCAVETGPAPDVAIGSLAEQPVPSTKPWVNYLLHGVNTAATVQDITPDSSEQCRYQPPSHIVEVSVTPAEGGRILAEGLDCPGDCSEVLPENTLLDFLALPADGYSFSGWQEDCIECGDQDTCKVEVNADLSCSARFEIAQSNQPPRITAFSATPISGSAPLEATFQCIASDPDGRISFYDFDFGDGSPSSPSEDGRMLHTYAAAGSYQASCQAWDDQEAASEPAMLDINVQQPSWQTITDQLNFTRSLRPLFDRRHRVFFSLITVENPGAALAGPIRMVIEDPTFPIATDVGVGLEPDGYTDEGEAYFIIVPQGEILDTGAHLDTLRVNFAMQRGRLDYGLRIEQFR